jgi:hypothetical protein
VVRLPIRYEWPPEVLPRARDRVEVRGRTFVEATLERKVGRAFPVAIPPIPPPPGFGFRPDVPQPREVEVIGAESQVRRVRRVVASINPERAEGTIDAPFGLVARDADGQVVESVQIVPPRAHVRLELTQAIAVKQLLVSASLSGREAPGYQLYEAQIEPSLVRVAGPQDRLALINGLEIPVRVDGPQGGHGSTRACAAAGGIALRGREQRPGDDPFARAPAPRQPPQHQRRSPRPARQRHRRGSGSARQGNPANPVPGRAAARWPPAAPPVPGHPVKESSGFDQRRCF